MHLYNENDPYCADWLANLVTAGHLPPGVVDRRPIQEIPPDYVQRYTQFHAFCGIGLWPAALARAGVPPDVPVFTASPPCQPFSQANPARQRFKDCRNLWSAFFDVVKVCQPAAVFGEQVSNDLAWFDVVHRDLESESYAVAGADLCAAGVAAPHTRQRLYFAGLADTVGTRLQRRAVDTTTQEADRPTAWTSGAFGGVDTRESDDVEWVQCADGRRRPIKPGILPVVARDTPGMGRRSARIKAYGNALCLPVAVDFVRCVVAASLDVARG